MTETGTIHRKSTSILQKPDKLYLENTNLMYSLAETVPNTGTLRETFVLNQLSFLHTVEYPKKGDFLVNGKYTLEVGGPGKEGKQIKGLKKVLFYRIVANGLRSNPFLCGLPGC